MSGELRRTAPLKGYPAAGMSKIFEKFSLLSSASASPLNFSRETCALRLPTVAHFPYHASSASLLAVPSHLTDFSISTLAPSTVHVESSQRSMMNKSKSL
eukprot:Gregarina_sp_Poly_1__7667@NODE_4313_length_651_cov_2_953767_g2860_i0_p1_GENE_NODE_4313_length_651_cov_2_953767_g2860_i0NODE_4313_length_651_cov_2_953767_g2860_i0_p1_ORF_typecomplete_len100_score13_54_NODE_4313_length_651_cov_2_953767_g2860_i090389